MNQDAARKIAHHAHVAEQQQTAADRRQYERFELLAQVTVLDHERTGSFTVLNISAGGVLLRNDHNLEFAVGEAIRVQFDAPELATAFSIEAKIIRVVAPAGRTSALAAMWTSRDATATAGLSDLLWTLSKHR